MRKGLIYMSIKNVVVSILVVMVLVAPVLYSDWGARYEEENITVHDGDTIFSLIAEREPVGDIWDSVYRTTKINKLEADYCLQPGDELTLVIRKK